MTPRALYAPARLAGTPLLRTQTDDRLVDLVRAGNDGAFEAIVARYRRGLLRYCSSIVPGGRAEDAVQQSFLRAYDSLRASEGEMQLRPWLYRIAHNQSLNALRDRSLGHEELSEEVDGVERPDQAFEGRERLRDVMAAVAALPERQRDAIVLRELEGRTYDEIAADLGVTRGAVRALLNRARGTLRAGMTAITPYGLMVRVPFDAAEPASARVAELCGAGAGGAVVAKACATVLVTGAVVGGVASSPDSGTSDSVADRPPREARVQPTARGPQPPRAPALAPATGSGDDSERRGHGDGDDDGDDDRSGRRGGSEPDDDRSGPGGGEVEIAGPDGGSSGPNPGVSSSGSGSSESGSGSSGSGSGSSGSGSGSSGSGSGSSVELDAD